MMDKENKDLNNSLNSKPKWFKRGKLYIKEKQLSLAKLPISVQSKLYLNRTSRILSGKTIGGFLGFNCPFGTRTTGNTC
jgi:hypothetical protein